MEERNKIHHLGLPHHASGLVILRKHEKNIQMLSQQRSYQKEKNAGLWDMSVSGHVPSGETPLASLKREAKEEIGLDVDEKDLFLLGKFWRHEVHRENFVENELDYIYLLIKNLDLKKVKIQHEELETVDWIYIQDFKKMLKEKTAVWRENVWDALFQYVEKNPNLFSSQNQQN